MNIYYSDCRTAYSFPDLGDESFEYITDSFGDAVLVAQEPAYGIWEAYYNEH